MAGGEIQNRIKYINSISVFVSDLDLKVDDKTIQICLEMYKRLNLSKSKQEIEEIRQSVTHRFKPVYLKLDEKETHVSHTNRVYIKRLAIERFKIILTFRTAASNEESAITNNFFSDFGLIFASIKDATITLEGFKNTHIFGTTNAVLMEVYSYYRSNVSKAKLDQK